MVSLDPYCISTDAYTIWIVIQMRLDAYAVTCLTYVDARYDFLCVPLNLQLLQLLLTIAAMYSLKTYLNYNKTPSTSHSNQGIVLYICSFTSSH